MENIKKERQPLDYKYGKIYVIRSYKTNLVYVGSTTQHLCQRMSKHRINYKQWLKNGTGFMTSYKLLDFDDAYIELLEEYPCENKNQLQRKEGEYIRNMENVVNKFIAGRTHAEYKKDNRDIINQHNDCECGGHYIHNHKARHLRTNKHKKYIQTLTNE